MFVPMRNYGKFGFISDTPASMLPVGAWNFARNVRFKGNYIERCLEPDTLDQLDSLDPQSPNARDYPAEVMWGQQFYDGQIVRFVVATRTDLYIVNSEQSEWIKVTRASGTYNTPEGGYWQSFSWGNTVVFNNGVDIPQVYDADANIFIDLPKWGIITKEDGTPDYDTRARARWIVPYKSFLVAGNIIESLDSFDDSPQPNAVWWSNGYQSPDLWKDQGNAWDYNTSENNLSGKNLIGLEDGPLQWAAGLGEGLILYNSSSAHQMLFTGGPFVMDFRRLFDYGCVGLYGASEFLNFHLVVGPDVLYVHDGNTIKQVAEDKVRDWFYRNVRNLESTVRTVTDYSNREVVIAFDMNPDEFLPATPDPARVSLVYNYDDDNWTVIDASVQRGGVLYSTVCMVYGLDLGRVTEVGQTWDQSNLEWDEYGEVTWNTLQGGAASQAVKVSMFWITASGLYRANTLSTPATLKSYLVRKTNMDLDEINPQLTTNLWKHLRQVYPHIVGDGRMYFRSGWSANLESGPIWGEKKEYWMTIEDTPQRQQEPSVKIDCRTTGRYLAIEFEFSGVRAMRFTGADFDVLPVYGR